MSAQILSFAVASARRLSGLPPVPVWQPKAGDMVRCSMPLTGERITGVVRLVLVPDLTCLHHRVLVATRFGPQWCEDAEPLL